MPLLTVDTDFDQDVQLYFEDHGSGRPILLIHGWPLDGQSWEYNKPALIDAGFRVITIDRRGFGKSGRPWNGYDYDTFASDVDKLLTHLDLTDVTIVGFSMGGGEVARYLGTYGSARIAQAVFAAAVPPYLYVTEGNEVGALDDATIDGFLAGIDADRPAFLKGFVENFFTAAGKSDLVSDEIKAAALGSAIVASPKGTRDCVVAFSKTDFRDDLAKIDVPTLVIHGDGDAILPIAATGELTAKLVKNSTYRVIEGGPHGLNVSHAAEFNEVLLAFARDAVGATA